MTCNIYTKGSAFCIYYLWQTKRVLPNVHRDILKTEVSRTAQIHKAPYKKEFKDGSKIILYISQQKTLHCDLSFEISEQDSSNEGSQHMLLYRNRITIP